jgi:hypothetical protein
MKTTTESFEWVFDSNRCVVIGHRIGCKAADKRAGHLHRMGQAATAEELDDVGHPVTMCRCTR